MSGVSVLLYVRVMELDAAIARLKSRPYCLWTGAGVAIHLGQSAGVRLPLWSEITALLEDAAGVTAPSGSPFSSRIDVALEAIGRERFQRKLREQTLLPLAGALLQARRANIDVPGQVRSVTRLAYGANPVVNFNIETISSEAMACGGGSWQPVCFAPPIPDSTSKPTISRSAKVGDRFLRNFYHPHGAIDITGICVMARREYASMNGTLALQLAVHAAFGLPLAIVGMSLDDEYLLEQISAFRHQIPDIYWFTDSPPSSDMVRWAFENGLHVVIAPWEAFWSSVDRELPSPPEEDLEDAWTNLCVYCVHSENNPSNAAINHIAAMGNCSPVDLAQRIFRAKMHGEIVEWNPSNIGTQPLGDETRRFLQENLDRRAARLLLRNE